MSEPLADLGWPAPMIFDLDGTLGDAVGTRLRAWLAVFEEGQVWVNRRTVASLVELEI